MNLYTKNRNADIFVWNIQIVLGTQKSIIKNIKNERLILHNIFPIIFGYVTYMIIKNVMPLFFIRLPKPLGCHCVFYQTTINICNTFSGFQWLRNYRCQEEDTYSRLLICLRPISFMFWYYILDKQDNVTCCNLINLNKHYTFRNSAL